MSKQLRCAAVVLLAVALAACGSSAPRRAGVKPGTPSSKSAVELIGVARARTAPSAAALRAAAHGEEEFAVALYRRLAAGGGDVAIAPSSIATVIGMIVAGAKATTARQMVDALHVDLPDAELHDAIGGLARTFGDRTRKGVTLQEVDQAWLQRGRSVLAAYADTLAGPYGAPLATIDFGQPDAAAATINGWFGDHTHGKIAELIDASDLETAALVLTDAVYLDAQWANGFDPKLTAPAPFHLANGSTVSVPTMHLNDAPALGYATGAGWKAVTLPYRGKQLEMDVIIPDDLHAFEASLDAAQLSSVVAALRPAAVVLSMPSFDSVSRNDLVGPLQDLGIRDAFDTTRADLSGIDGKRDLFVSDVKHEVVVHVDERGTVAAAATAGIISPTSARVETIVNVDKPFVYVVRDRATGAILFLGRTSDPR